MRRLAWVALLIALIFSVGVVVSMNSRSNPPILKVGLPGPWNTLHPGLQHTLFGDLVMSNQFEALVGVNEDGAPIPLGAKSWQISDDFTLFRFSIDTSRTFSDGSHLTALDFKRSWEESARLDPISANSSLLDVLYKIDGFDHFQQDGTISGIKILPGEILEIRFSSPFRMALEHLQGVRFSAYKKVDQNFIGTGVFIIEERDKHHIVMHPRQKYLDARVPTLEVSFIPANEISAKLLNGELDAVHYMSGHSADANPMTDSSIETLVGQSSVHMSIGLNSGPRSIFSSAANRRALQYLISEVLAKKGNLLAAERFFDLDFQHFLPFQAGRLEDPEVQRIIAQGAVDVHHLIAATNSRPVVVKSGVSTRKVIDLIKETGISITEDSGPLSSKEYLELSYAKEGPDIIVQAYSVASGDPDGIYHCLGKNGAIRTPYVFSEKVSDLLESGRKITDHSELDTAYKEVSRALLTEVPAIHLGFGKAITAYRKDRVYVDKTILIRNQGQMHFLRAKP